MQEIKAPNKFIKTGRTVFLGGSIEMGTAEEWQERIAQALADTDWIVLNPRREHWHNSWHETKDNPKFREQVQWELAGMEAADKIIMYFSPQTKSPISCLELGLHAHSGKLIVCCPEGFWRKGNIDIVCEKYGIKQVQNFEDIITELKQ